MKNLKSSLVLLLILFACEEDAPLKSAVKVFAGTWSWTYVINCGIPENHTGDIVITESDVNKGELYVVLPEIGGFEAQASGEPYPLFTYSNEDGNGVFINVTAFLNNDGVLDITASQSDDDPSYYCAVYGDAVKQ